MSRRDSSARPQGHVCAWRPVQHGLVLALLSVLTGAAAQMPGGSADPAPAAAPASRPASAASAPAPTASAPEANRIQFGTGFVVDNGYIVTAWHVLQGRSQWLVGPNAAGRWVPATLVKSDQGNDIALLKAPLDAPPLPLAHSSEVPIGLEVSVIGFPQPRYQGLTRKITQGHVNGVQRASQQEMDTGLLQFSAEVAMGNSGGPVLAPDGAVVGMVQRKLDAQRIAQQTNDWMVNVSYAVRSSTVIRFLQDSPARVTVRPLQLATVLRPYQVFQQASGSVISVIARGGPPAAAPAAPAQDPAGLLSVPTN